MSEKEYKINYETMRHYLSAFISKENISNQKNTKHILNILETLPEHLISSLMMLAIKVDEYIPFKEGDFVTFQPTYLMDYDKDIMIEKKLMDSGGNMFGEIINDGSWGSEPFNPYYSVMNVSIFLWRGRTRGLRIWQDGPDQGRLPGASEHRVDSSRGPSWQEPADGQQSRPLDDGRQGGETAQAAAQAGTGNRNGRRPRGLL